MEHRPIGTGKLEITSMQICRSDGLAPQQATTCHSHDGHHEVPIEHPVTFLLWGYVKDNVFVPPVPVTVDDLKQRITTATEGDDEDMLMRVWQVFDYRVDICRVTKGAHTEHL
jgi:hypothetical protein